MVLMVQEILKVSRTEAWQSQGQTYELRLRRGLVNRAHYRVIALGVLLGGHLVLKVDLVEHLPHGQLVVVARLVAHSVLIGKAAVHIPTDEAAVVVAQFFASGIAQFSALRVVPDGLVGVDRTGDGFARFEDPGGNGAEVHDGRMALGSREKIFGHGVDEAEVPTGLLVRGRLQLGHGQPRVGQPRYIAHIVGAQIPHGFVGGRAERLARPERRIHDHLQRRSGL